MRTALAILIGVMLLSSTRACIWDADTLSHEKSRSHDLASAILGSPQSEPMDIQALQARIQNLETNHDENNSNWWNNLAGAYMRLGEPQKAIDLLEPVISRFPHDYGMHANLGTAYHLLGRYADAEKEIARDLEINPDAHFGLEKYHLALLQYLVRDAEYKKEHVYVDEWSRGFQSGHYQLLRRQEGRLDSANTNALNLEAIKNVEGQLSKRTPDDQTNSWEWKEIQDLKSQGYVPPPYRFKWDLASDTNLTEGVIYMAQMNPKEPACFEMLGIVACQRHDYNLAVVAFEKAVTLGSLKSELLSNYIANLRYFIKESHKQNFLIFGLMSLMPLTIVYYIYTKIRDRRRRLKTST